MLFISLGLILLPFTSALVAPRANNSTYAPLTSSCPSEPLVRPAIGLSENEVNFLALRKPNAEAALTTWLHKINQAFTTDHLPTVALVTSGGGYRSHLTGAGVVQGLDAREGTTAVAGLYQAFTYHTALSGGSWMLGSLAGNNWPTVSSLQNNLWAKAFNSGLWWAGFSLSNPTLYRIANDIRAKSSAGFNVVLTDFWGRLLSDQLLYGTDGGVADTMSGIAMNSNFSKGLVPYPIMSTRGVDVSAGQCQPLDNATLYEMSPFEFGSWDKGVEAFVQTRYLGSNIINGSPENGQCVTGFDNLGYLFGASSSLFNEGECSALQLLNDTAIPALIRDILTPLVKLGTAITNAVGFAYVPNPFHGYSGSPLISQEKNIALVDGGEAENSAGGQSDTIWPLIHPARTVDVIFVNDNSGDTVEGYPNTHALQETIKQAQAQGLGERLPQVPSEAEYVAKNMGAKPTFFGCNNTAAVTLIYVPNFNYTYKSGISAYLHQVPTAETVGMIANGNSVATKNGDPMWATCLACGIMAKARGQKPDECSSCINEYCYN